MTTCLVDLIGAWHLEVKLLVPLEDKVHRHVLAVADDPHAVSLVTDGDGGIVVSLQLGHHVSRHAHGGTKLIVPGSGHESVLAGDVRVALTPELAALARDLVHALPDHLVALEGGGPLLLLPVGALAHHEELAGAELGHQGAAGVVQLGVGGGELLVVLVLGHDLVAAEALRDLEAVTAEGLDRHGQGLEGGLHAGGQADGLVEGRQVLRLGDPEGPGHVDLAGPDLGVGDPLAVGGGSGEALVGVDLGRLGLAGQFAVGHHLEGVIPVLLEADLYRQRENGILITESS